MNRVAAIDCGTNSIRLLIAEPAGDGTLVDVAREMRIVRLGQGVDRTGRLAPEAIARTREALVDYAQLIDEHGASAVRMVATSATRDAANRDEFTTMVHRVLGAEPEVITGAEEAALSFAGAVAGLPGAASPVLVADIGGGSTELVLGNGELAAHSMDIGCVRMTERHLRADPPSKAQIAATVADVRAAIEVAARDVPIAQAATFVGVAGTVTTLAAIVHGMPSYDPAAIHGSTMTAAEVADVTARVLAMTHEQRAALPVMHPGRVDVIGGGALILRELVAAAGVSSVVASEHDILDGIAAGLSAGSASRVHR
ncbi:MAG TPA: Ppx/GppA phosphatase family protein [Jatrophihabitantaceae bacterium]|jgi:exopolyphosphatase/guanosine-5'-triphosphate,3'-diphosphate pyrophosphatase